LATVRLRSALAYQRLGLAGNKCRALRRKSTHRRPAGKPRL